MTCWERRGSYWYVLLPCCIKLPQQLWLLLWQLDMCKWMHLSIFETCILVPKVLTLTEAQLIKLAR